MKLTDLSKDDLSRWIAEKIETNPPSGKFGGKSLLGWWQWNGQNWHPRPYDDPAICARLLKWLVAADGWEVYLSTSLPYGQNCEIECTPTEDGWMQGKRGFVLTHPVTDLERCIAEAAALAMGWTE